MDILRALFYYFIFPGFLFLAFSGMIVSWVDRKLTARVQWRVGPPLFQPMYDVIKLFLKETLIPAKGNPFIFVIAPVVSVLSVILAADIVMLALMNPARGFLGDTIVILYILTIPPAAMILGASASGNPFASLGASREMKLVLGYELPFVASMLIPIIGSGSLSLGNIITYQQSFGSFAGTISGLTAFLITVICAQGKMCLAPFDISEAETELAGGTQIEYSGPLLALWKLNKMMLSVVVPLFIIAMFWAGGNPLAIPLKYAALLVAATLIRNTNPRVRIDQAVRFFWGVMALACVFNLILFMRGN